MLDLYTRYDKTAKVRTIAGAIDLAGGNHKQQLEPTVAGNIISIPLSSIKKAAFARYTVTLRFLPLSGGVSRRGLAVSVSGTTVSAGITSDTSTASTVLVGPIEKS